MTSSNTGPFGRFSYTIGSQTWWWSDPLYEIHGFAPGDVVPTTELILSHKPPEDAAAAQAAMAALLADGDEFALWHRVVDAGTKVRQVLSVGGGVWNAAGTLTHVRGFMVDVKAREVATDLAASVTGTGTIPAPARHEFDRLLAEERSPVDAGEVDG